MLFARDLLHGAGYVSAAFIALALMVVILTSLDGRRRCQHKPVIRAARTIRQGFRRMLFRFAIGGTIVNTRLKWYETILALVLVFSSAAAMAQGARRLSEASVGAGETEGCGCETGRRGCEAPSIAANCKRLS